MTRIVTFYSYKGGVGRTMALVNTGYLLAHQGWRVLMIDFDLEAPGMTHFFTSAIQSRPKNVDKDSVDLLNQVREHSMVDEAQLSSLAEYTVNIPLPKNKEETSPYRRGRLDLLPATLEPGEGAPMTTQSDYLARLDALNLPSIFSEKGLKHNFGLHVRRFLRRCRFTVPGDRLFTLRETVQACYDVILIDSRTGLNEVSGLCIGPICDVVVVCTGLNNQNLHGTKYFMKSTHLLEANVGKPYVIVAGPVPPWHTRESKELVAKLCKALLRDRVIEIPYHPLAAIKETIFVQTEPDEPISAAYRELGKAVLSNIRLTTPSNAFADEGFYSYAHRAALDLHFRRFSLADPSGERPSAVLNLFPTAVSLNGLALNRNALGDRSPDSERLSLAAAVAAQVSESWEPFELALSYAQHFGKPSNDLIARLAYFKLNNKTKPSDDDPILRALRALARNLLASDTPVQKFMESREPTIDVLISWLVHLSSGERGAEWEQCKDLISVLWDFGNWTLYGRSRLGTFLSQSQALKVASSYTEALLIAVISDSGWEQFDSDFNQALRDLRNEVMTYLDLPQNWKELSSMKDVRAIEDAVEMLRTRGPRPDRELTQPLCLWPELLYAAYWTRYSAYEVDEILWWLALARLRYGFAWKVMFTSRSFDLIREGAAYREFEQAENAIVARIEGGITAGAYSL